MSNKDAYYFPHDAGARNDFKVKGICKKFTLLGYAWYFIILEIMREQSCYGLPENLLSLIADDLKITEKETIEFVNYCCEIGLFYKKNGYLFSSSFIVRMRKMDDLRNKRKLAGSKGGNARANTILTSSNAKAMLKQTSSIKLKEIKLKEIKGNKNKLKNISISPSAEPINNEYVDNWNQLAKTTNLPEILRMTKSRNLRLKNRISEDKDFKAHFDICLNKIKDSGFLKGNTGWKITFDWLINNDKNYLKVLEGNYDNKNQNNGDMELSKKTQDTLRVLANVRRIQKGG